MDSKVMELRIKKWIPVMAELLPLSILSNKEVDFVEIPSAPIHPAIVAGQRSGETIKTCGAPLLSASGTGTSP